MVLEQQGLVTASSCCAARLLGRLIDLQPKSGGSANLISMADNADVARKLIDNSCVEPSSKLAEIEASYVERRREQENNGRTHVGDMMVDQGLCSR